MAQQAFVIDQGRCIGCHACTVACKVEHGVELGVFRTWVKYIERGEFPDTRRHFCGACAATTARMRPCVEVCPVTALYKREDGIVDFDPERCIGCKACLNACPYDALYIDPNSHTAAKCNFCAHRVELDLKPSCEVVCPVGAIISGDVDDPDSEVSRLLGTAPSAVRSPEQGTGPERLLPRRGRRRARSAGGRRGRRVSDDRGPAVAAREAAPLHRPTRRRSPRPTSTHPPPWGWKVSSYFLSKGDRRGRDDARARCCSCSARADPRWRTSCPGLLALAGIAATGVFLVWDLKQPRRVLLPVHAAAVAFVAGARHAGDQCRGASSRSRSLLAASRGWHGLRDGLRWALVPAGALLAGYTAFLFNQCEGRDLWQSPLLLAAHDRQRADRRARARSAIAAFAVTCPVGAAARAGWTLVLGVAASAA